MEPSISMMPTIALHTASPFKDLFPIRENTLSEIVESMKNNGFDWSMPIILWAGHKVTVVDGHTRLAAAQKLHLNQVPVVLHEFKDETDAIQFAIRAQKARRSLTDSELLACINALDTRNPKGGSEYSKASHEALGKSAKKTADLLGISRSKVERLRTVNDHGSDKTKAAVSAGKITINKAYNQTMQERKAQEVQQEDLSAEKLAEIRAERITTMVNGIAAKVKAQFQREIQEYPELRYTIQERNHIDDCICNEISKLVEAMIPRETEETENTGEEE